MNNLKAILMGILYFWAVLIGAGISLVLPMYWVINFNHPIFGVIYFVTLVGGYSGWAAWGK